MARDGRGMIGKIKMATAAAFAAATLAASPGFDGLSGLSIDALTTLRWRALGERQDLAKSPTAVIALDEETFSTPPFKGTPTVAWTREIGRIITAVLDGGALVVGFDIVIPISLEQSEIAFD